MAERVQTLISGVCATGKIRGLAAVVLLLALLPLTSACDGASDTTCERLCPARTAGQPRDTGYAVLQKLLGDEEHVKTLRIVKSVVTLHKSSAATSALIDDIARVSAAGLADLERLVTLQPAIDPDVSSEERLGNGILDALRVATARDLILASGDEFEVNLVISQTQALRLITQLLKELQAIDPNPRRRSWLDGLAGKYEKLYSRAMARLSVSGG